MTLPHPVAPQALLLDLEGTLHMGDEPIPGAPAAIRRLADLRVPVRFITNTTRYSRTDLTRRLRSMGFEISEDQLFTAPRAAASLLRQRGFGRVMLCVPPSTRSDFAGLEDAVDRVEAVVVGDLGREWSFDRLNAAFRALVDGALLVALQKNRYWRTPDGLSLDAGPFVAALEYGASTTAVVVGKPAEAFFAIAADSVGTKPGDITVVGDDLEADVAGGQAAGMRGVLVRTGKFSEETLERSHVTPDEIGDSLPQLVDRWFGS